MSKHFQFRSKTCGTFIGYENSKSGLLKPVNKWQTNNFIFFFELPNWAEPEPLGSKKNDSKRTQTHINKYSNGEKIMENYDLGHTIKICSFVQKG